jgi:pilus assembly protein CpaF
MEGDIITMQELFRFDFDMGFDDEGRSLGRLKSTGLRPHFEEKLAAGGIQLDDAAFTFETFEGR